LRKRIRIVVTLDQVKLKELSPKIDLQWEPIDNENIFPLLTE